jgi:hypothetical protein
MIWAGEAVTVHVGGSGAGGGVVTVTVALVLLPAPAALLPMTVYVVVATGETVPPDAVETKPVLPLHAQEVAAGLQVAVRVEV